MTIKKTLTQISLATLISFNLSGMALAGTLEDAQQAIEKKDFATAVIHLKNQLKETPKNAQARFLLGRLYLQQGKLDSSIKELSRAHEYAPDNTEFTFLYAEALQIAGKYKKLQKLLDTPFSDKKQEATRLSFLGFAHLASRQLADARQAFEESIAANPNVRAYNGLATIGIMENDLEQAKQYLSKSETLEPENTSTRHLKAKLANLDKQPEQALTIYNQLIKDQPKKLNYKLERAATFIILGQTDKAEEDLKQILEKAANHPQANFLLAQILLTRKDFKGAQEAAQNTVNVMPDHKPATLILGAANLGLNNYNQAAEYLIIYLSSNPTDLKAQNLLANVYLAQGKAKQALLILEGIPAEQRDKEAPILLTLGSSYILAGQNKQALDILTHAHELYPDNQDIKKRLIAAQFQSGNLDTAVSELEELVSDQQGSAQDQTNSNYLLVASYLKQQQTEKAQQLIKQLLQQTPNDRVLQNLSAITEFQMGNKDKAVEIYNKLINQDKNNIQAYMGLARIAASEENWADAEKNFKQVIKIKPDNLKAYLGLAVIAEKQKQPELAEQYFLDAINQSRENPAAQLTIASLLSQWYQSLHKPEKILELAQTLVKQHPDNTRIMIFLAKAQVANKQKAEAERTLNNITAFDKEDITHRVLLAALLAEDEDRINEALDVLDTAMTIEPDNLSLYLNKASLYLKKGDYQLALKVARDIQQEFPDSTNGKLLEADIYRLQKRYEPALSIYESVYSTESTRKILSAMVDMYIALDQPDKAMAALEKALNTDPDDIESLFKLASLYHEKNQLDKARHYYDQILHKIPNHIVTLNNLSWIYMDTDIEKALELARKAHELAPGSAAIADTYAYALAQSGDAKKALELLQQAAEKLPDDNDVQYHLAYTYKQLGQTQKAKAILEKIVNTEKHYMEQDKAKALYGELQ